MWSNPKTERSQGGVKRSAPGKSLEFRIGFGWCAELWMLSSWGPSKAVMFLVIRYHFWNLTTWSDNVMTWCNISPHHTCLEITSNHICKVKNRFTIIAQIVGIQPYLAIVSHHKDSNGPCAYDFKSVSSIPFHYILCMILVSRSHPPSSFTPNLNVSEHLFRRVLRD